MATAKEKNEKDTLLPPKDAGSCFQARHALAFWAFVGFFNVYCLRVNLSVALVAMVNSSVAVDNSSVSEECPEDRPGNSSSSSDNGGEFNWDETTQGLILGAFFYGYIFTQLPGGWLAERVGGKKLFGFGCLSTAVLTLVTPVAARAGIPYFVAVRVLEGLGEGVTFPAMHAMWAQWAPIYERSTLAAITYSGAQLGTVFAMPISGILCEHGFAGGWPSVFYVFGALGCVWFVFWMALVHDSPAQHPRISDAEKHYIESSIGHRERLPTPWKDIALSPAVWAVSVAHFSNNWGFYSMLTCLPTYLKKILHFDMTQDGFLSGVPYLVLWLTQLMSGFVADYLRRRGYLSTGATRKMFNTTGCILPAALMVATGYAGCNHTLAVVLLTLGVGSAGFTMSGYNVNHLDIAPRFAGTLLGITNAIATVPGFLGPAVVGILTNHNQTTGQWRIFFFITAAIYLGGALVFLLLGKGEEQRWAKAPDSAFSVAAPEPVCSVQSRTQSSEVSCSSSSHDSCAGDLVGRPGGRR
ncbi:sialin-like [Babylonia areolata]|uniref:sialin-like n=1 Tax=Babylonia areolata TaxID=304850 RepID=UPI003FCFFE09